MRVNEASRIIFDYSRVMLQIMAAQTADTRDIIYDHLMFIVEATGLVGI
jgi:hypothetical protein